MPMEAALDSTVDKERVTETRQRVKEAQEGASSSHYDQNDSLVID